jgi:hypothetical protein
MSKRRPGDPIRRARRLSEAELIEESHAVLTAGGVRNHLRARFVRELSEAVVGNPSPLLHHLQAKFLPAKGIAWKRAFQIVFQFLEDNSLSSTQKTFEIESPNTRRQLVVCASPRNLKGILQRQTENVPQVRKSGKARPALTIIPPGRLIDGPAVRSPTRNSAVPSEIIVPPPESEDGSPVSRAGGFPKRLPPMGPAGPRPQAREPRPKPLSPTGRKSGGFSRQKPKLALKRANEAADRN